MATIWKTVLQPTDLQEIEVPEGCGILSLQEQFGQICLWYKCDPLAPKVKRTIAIVGTGHAAPENNEADYIGTVQLRNGNLVLHVFEKI